MLPSLLSDQEHAQLAEHWDILQEDERWATLQGLSQDHILTWVGACLRAADIPFHYCGSIVLMDDASIQEYNRDYRGKDSPTNVLSFPANDEDDATPDGAPLLLGDILLAYDTILREADEQNKPVLHHVAHMIIHGVLHLCGYDHIDDADAQAMEALEIQILRDFSIPTPYNDTVIQTNT